MYDRASRRVSEEIERHLIAPVVERLPLGGLARRALGVVGALELVVPRGVLEVFERRRMIAHGGELDLDDALT
jgi:hypothetical protein